MYEIVKRSEKNNTPKPVEKVNKKHWEVETVVILFVLRIMRIRFTDWLIFGET